MLKNWRWQTFGHQCVHLKAPGSITHAPISKCSLGLRMHFKFLNKFCDKSTRKRTPLRMDRFVDGQAARSSTFTEMVEPALCFTIYKIAQVLWCLVQGVERTRKHSTMSRNRRLSFFAATRITRVRRTTQIAKFACFMSMAFIDSVVGGRYQSGRFCAVLCNFGIRPIVTLK